MIKIGITSNIKKYYKGYIDFIDHYWINFFEKKKIEYSLLPNNFALSKKMLRKKNLLILSGGNDLFSNQKEAQIRNNVERKLISEAINNKIPILGICRGAQILNQYFGGNIKKLKFHMRVRHNIYFENNNIFRFKKLNVNSYHNYGINSDNLSKKFEVIAFDNKKNIELYMYKKKKILGAMWHPEREKNYKNLIKLINYFTK